MRTDTPELRRWTVRLAYNAGFDDMKSTITVTALSRLDAIEAARTVVEEWFYDSDAFLKAVANPVKE